MHRLSVFIGLLLVVIIFALPAFAGSRRYAQETLDFWIESIEEEGYEVFYSDVDMIEEDYSYSYSFELGAGNYLFVAEGGEDIEDLDMYVYDEDGYELDSNTLVDNYPMCGIYLERPGEIEVEIVAYEFHGREYEDYFCFAAAGESGGNRGTDRGSAADPDDIMDHWLGWAEDEGMDVIFTDIGRLSRDNSETYEFELDQGMYCVCAESLYEDDDIDLFIYDEDYRELDSDTLADNYPICTFDLRRPESVEIEVSPYTYAIGNSTRYVLVISAEAGGDILEPDRDRAVAPVTDDADSEYTHGLLDFYMELVEADDYEMIFDQVEIIEEYTTDTVRITLGRGDYVVFAEGGLRISDLDLRVHDEDGDLLAEDNLVNRTPVCEFSSFRSSTFEIEIESYDFEPGWTEGYYVLVVVRE